MKQLYKWGGVFISLLSLFSFMVSCSVHGTGEIDNKTEPTSYTVTVASGIEHGSVTANPTSAAAGTEIVLTVTPETGYKLKTLTVTKAAGGEVTTTPDNNTPTKYKFTMPESNVNVSAVFEHASKNIPLTLEAIAAGTITITNPWSTLKFTKNGGELTSCGGAAEHEIIVEANDIICFYAESSGNSSANYGNNNMKISCTADCYVYGNIMSLVTLETGATSASQWNPEETTLTTGYAFNRLFWQNSPNSHIKNHATKTLYLPATTLTAHCYESMFYQCTALTTAPKLPATTLTDFCYASMFKQCTALTTAPELPAATLTESCYANMFTECTSLSYIKCLATDISALGCTTIWVRDVATSGTFVRPASTTGWTTGEHGIPSGWTTEDAQ